MVRIIALLMLVACTLLGARAAQAWVYEPNANITSIVFESGDTVGDVCVQLKNAGRMPVIPERHRARWHSQVRWCIDQTLAINKLTYVTAHSIPVGAVLQFPHLPPDALVEPPVAHAAAVSIDVHAAVTEQVAREEERRELQDTLVLLQRALDEAKATELASARKVDAKLDTLQRSLDVQAEELRTARIEVAAVEDLRTALKVVKTSDPANRAYLANLADAAAIAAVVLALLLLLCLAFAVSALRTARATLASMAALVAQVNELTATTRVVSATV